MTTKKSSFVRLSALLTLCLSLFFTPRPVQAATITVDTAIDKNDGSCNNGDCSLREAITTAASGDTITFAGDYTIYLNSQLSITKTLTIDGGSHAVTLSGDTGNDGSKNVRVMSFNGGTLTLNHLTITNGYESGNGGGGVYLNSGSLVVRDSAFLNNATDNNGGAITSLNSTNSMIIENSTFSGNSAGTFGGAVFQNSSLTLTNSTFSGNSASYGGGLYNMMSALTMTNTLLANNTNGDCDLHEGTISGNHNLIKSDSCGYTNGVNGNITGVDPLLSPLGNYGGVTQTFALLPGSPAIDAGSSCPSADQRGISRPSGACDMSAFESQGFSLTSASGSPQSTAFNTSFASPLVVSVASSHSEPVDGGKVTFTAPSSGASISPAAGSATISTGSASYTPTANSIGGTYTVSATTRGNTGSAALFTLTNLAPEIAVSGSSVDITSGDASPSLSDGTDFGLINGGLKPAHTFTIRNTGEANLTVSSISLSGANPGDFAVSGITFPAAVAPGSSADLTLTFTPDQASAAGVRSAVISIESDDGDESPFTFAVQGTYGGTPEISVLGNDLVITNGDDTPATSDGTDFGELFVEHPLTRTFTVSNPGSADLTLSQITLTGSTDFTTSGLSLPAVIAPGASASFTVTLTPSLTGAQTAVLSIFSDAPGASPYVFSLKGNAIPSKFYVFLPAVLK